MAMLHDLIKLGLPAKLRKGRDWFSWDGDELKSSLCRNLTYREIVFHNDWEFDGPTVDDVLKKHGYYLKDDWGNSRGTWFCKNEMCLLWIKSRPTTVPEVSRIIDFLESLPA